MEWFGWCREKTQEAFSGQKHFFPDLGRLKKQMAVCSWPVQMQILSGCKSAFISYSSKNLWTDESFCRAGLFVRSVEALASGSRLAKDIYLCLPHSFTTAGLPQRLNFQIGKGRRWSRRESVEDKSVQHPARFLCCSVSLFQSGGDAVLHSLVLLQSGKWLAYQHIWESIIWHTASDQEVVGKLCHSEAEKDIHLQPWVIDVVCVTMFWIDWFRAVKARNGS